MKANSWYQVSLRKKFGVMSFLVKTNSKKSAKEKALPYVGFEKSNELIVAKLDKLPDVIPLTTQII